MPDSRPAPQYGEYATPEEVAALRGTPVEPAPVAAPPVVRPPRPSGARRYDRPATIALLLFGLINLLQYAGPLMDFANTLDRYLIGTPYDAIDFGEAARIGGLVLLGILTVLLVAAVACSYLLLRRGRVAFWVPLTAGALTILAWVATLTVVVLQTPGALSTPGT
jgi:hypothetical protein